MKSKSIVFGCVVVLSVLGMRVNAVCPSMDFTGDCFVDLADFAVFAGQWLTGYRLPGDMTIIPTGTFQMGDSFNEGASNERPIHIVTLDSFAMGKYEITNGQYCAFLKSAYPSQLKVVEGVVYASGDTDNSYPYCTTSASDSRSQIVYSNNTFNVQTKGGKDMTSHPMVMVSWYGSVAYCNWRSQQEGKQICYNLSTWTCDFTKKGYRLATEAEWEYAARGGRTRSRFPWGDTITHNQANYQSYWEGGNPTYPYDLNLTEGFHPTWDDGISPYTSQVGSFRANRYGLHDMAGNVLEWCNDWYGGYTSSSQTNPTGPETGTWRVLRGGGWGLYSYHCRVSCRNDLNLPTIRDGNLGFRVVQDLK